MGRKEREDEEKERTKKTRGHKGVGRTKEEEERLWDEDKEGEMDEANEEWMGEQRMDGWRWRKGWGGSEQWLGREEMRNGW